MFSKAIFKQTLKANARMLLLVTIVTSLMLVAMVAVFDPSTIKSLGSSLGSTGLVHTSPVDPFLSMLGSTFFSLQGVLLPIIYVVLTANGLIASQVDKGSMAYLLSTPTKRTTVVRTQALFMITSLIFMFAVVTGVGILSIHQFQSGVDIDMTKYYELIFGLFLLMFATSGISFFASSLFNLSKNSLLLGAGLPVAFFLLHLMSTMSSSLEGLKYFSLNTLFDTSSVLKGDDILLNFSILAIIGIILYLASLFVFKKKDLPL
ncbi:ABC transporter permease subunit [Lactococcus lactis]|uniref:ABC transporter permease subunit n=1 Tax=Lactococcus lactis TaxID=1358 RepID=A0A9X4S565_9LACT|nr:ABC transporter permease subunit [Lactococcus lactis]MDG4984800.1 ABC transporter permease subunit [Lactococcus lactis]